MMRALPTLTAVRDFISKFPSRPTNYRPVERELFSTTLRNVSCNKSRTLEQEQIGEYQAAEQHGSIISTIAAPPPIVRVVIVGVVIVVVVAIQLLP